MSVLRTIVSSSRALVTGAKDVARFREIAAVFVKHGFGWFIGQLKVRRELQIEFEYEGADLTRRAAGSEDTGKRLVAALTTLGPTFVKLGQILSTRPDLLPEPVIEQLTVLQDRVTAVEFSAIDALLRQNLGPDYRDLFAELDESPLASASIAQVHKATLKSGEEVVLKVQRPGVRRTIQSDLNIMLAIAGYMEEAFDEAETMDLRGVVSGFAKTLAQELDFINEARNIERFRRNFADEPRVRLPLVYDDLTTTEVLCMECLHGRKFSELLEAGNDTSPLVETYFNASYKMLFVDGFFHGDLHPGNVFVQDDLTLAIIDCGMVGRLSPAMKDKLIDILWSILNEDLPAVARTFFALAIHRGRVDYQAFEDDVIDVAERHLVGVPLSQIQIGELFGELVKGATRHKVRMPTDFTMVFKAIVTTEGLAKSIAPDVDPIELARPFIEQMVAERYSPDRLKQTALADFHMLSRVLRSLPQQLPAVLSDIQEGKIAVGIAPGTLRLQEDSARLRQRRALRTAISITCMVCGTYALSLELPGFVSIGLPYLSAFFYGAALIGFLLARWR